MPSARCERRRSPRGGSKGAAIWSEAETSGWRLTISQTMQPESNGEPRVISMLLEEGSHWHLMCWHSCCSPGVDSHGDSGCLWSEWCAREGSLSVDSQSMIVCTWQATEWPEWAQHPTAAWANTLRTVRMATNRYIGFCAQQWITSQLSLPSQPESMAVAWFSLGVPRHIYFCADFSGFLQADSCC